ncbi:hypothetical protein BOX15_Mlig008743g1 [Macrostomum lignano]|uniref:Carbonic anhydrase n=1 Tax=Macrostomum lignano TaxID=282301 RepID=A0A267DZ10_9PLAT|nr:hypothetical protein BOX15_Mlig011231g1 [Macrostomum lignano]PAA86629.1 hypothetical protein BOX15_Mlig008743g2 [Macrostomum lignano]PAA89785.1 hypothetical protein BOX15_Mlig008743g1 [Macrostomum lignano]
MGVERILRGVLNYRHSVQKLFQYELRDIKSHPNPSAVFISCMDARLFPNDFTLTKAGDMYVMRNAGNMAPPDELGRGATAAGVELGCIHNDIKDVIICGHSDCKAMALLWKLRDTIDTQRPDALSEWVRKYGRSSLKHYLAERDAQPMKFRSPIEGQSISAHIDPDKRYQPHDQLSQVHCLQQMINLTTYPFLSERLLQRRVRLSAMWFDVDSADVYMFSRATERFLVICEDNIEKLLPEPL